MERWLSGRKRRFAKPLGGVNLPRGFESLPLRLQFLPVAISCNLANTYRIFPTSEKSLWCTFVAQIVHQERVPWLVPEGASQRAVVSVVSPITSTTVLGTCTIARENRKSVAALRRQKGMLRELLRRSTLSCSPHHRRYWHSR